MLTYNENVHADPDDMIYSMKTILDLVPEIPDKEILKILNDNHLSPSYVSADGLNCFYSKKKFLKAKKLIKDYQYQNWKRKCYELGLVRIFDIEKDLKNVSNDDIIRYIHEFHPQVKACGKAKNSWYDKSIEEEISKMLVFKNNQSGVKRLSEYGYQKVKDQISTIQDYALQAEQSVDKLRRVIVQNGMHPAYIYDHRIYFNLETLDFALGFLQKENRKRDAENVETN